MRKMNPSLLIFPLISPLLFFPKTCQGQLWGLLWHLWGWRDCWPLVTEGQKRTDCKQRTLLVEPTFTMFSLLTGHEKKKATPGASVPKSRVGRGCLFSFSSPRGCMINTFPDMKWEKLIPYVMKRLPSEWRRQAGCQSSEMTWLDAPCAYLSFHTTSAQKRSL